MHRHLSSQLRLVFPVCVHDNRSEFVVIEFQELLHVHSYGVKSKLTTVQNPQPNGILEHTHQVIGNLLHSTHLMSQNLSTFEAHRNYSHLSPRPSTQLITLRSSNAQTARFQRDMIMPTTYLTNWAAIHHRCQEQSNNSVNKENNSQPCPS